MPDDYNAWKEDQAYVLTDLRSRDVWVMFSGGKDSSLSLFFLKAASEEFQFTFEVHAGLFPQHRYTASDVSKLDSFWSERGVEIQWHDVEESDDSLEKADDPCGVCQQVRKALFVEFIRRKPPSDMRNLVVVTAYNLWDLVSYTVERIMGHDLIRADGDKVAQSLTRFLETGQRFHSVLNMKRGYTMYRPILKYNKGDVAGIIQQASIPILNTPCSYARFRPKKILETYYESRQLNFHYERVLSFAEQCLSLPSVNEYESMTDDFLIEAFEHTTPE
jgi:tRNA(Ile)-lysidine synthase TilS/MesJ